MNFIKLTLQDGRETHVNIQKISDIIANGDKGSFVTFSGQYSATVKEKPELRLKEINEKLK